MKSRTVPPAAEDPDADRLLQAPDIKETLNIPPSQVFEGVDSLLEFATKHWQELWVTTDIWEGSTLDRFLQRPFFLLVSVDAPVSLRWERFVARSATHGLHLYEFCHPDLPCRLDAEGDNLSLLRLKNLFFGTTNIYTKRMQGVLISLIVPRFGYSTPPPRSRNFMLPSRLLT